jgi:hypothetical protein
MVSGFIKLILNAKKYVSHWYAYCMISEGQKYLIGNKAFLQES